MEIILRADVQHLGKIALRRKLIAWAQLTEMDPSTDDTGDVFGDLGGG